MMKRFYLATLLALCAAFTATAAIEVYEFDSPAQEEAFNKLGKELRCPKCQNNNIADSNAGLAQDLRLKVYEMLKDGKNEDEIVDYMIARYGNFVTYDPPCLHRRSSCGWDRCCSSSLDLRFWWHAAETPRRRNKEQL